MYICNIPSADAQRAPFTIDVLLLRYLVCLSLIIILIIMILVIIIISSSSSTIIITISIIIIITITIMIIVAVRGRPRRAPPPPEGEGVRPPTPFFLSLISAASRNRLNDLNANVQTPCDLHDIHI